MGSEILRSVRLLGENPRPLPRDKLPTWKDVGLDLNFKKEHNLISTATTMTIFVSGKVILPLYTGAVLCLPRQCIPAQLKGYAHLELTHSFYLSDA